MAVIAFAIPYLNKDRLVLLINEGDIALPQDAITYYFFSVPEAKEAGSYAIPINVTVKNDSGTRVEDLSLIFQYHTRFMRKLVPTEAFLGNPKRPSKEQRIVEVKRSGDYDYAIHSLPYLAPQESPSITDAAFAVGVPFDPKSPALFSTAKELAVKISTHSRQYKDDAWEIRYRGIHTENSNDLSRIIQKIYMQNIAREIRRDSSFLGYAWSLMFGKDIVIYSYDLKFKQVPNKNLFISSETPRTTTVYRFDPYSRDLLFGGP